MTDTDELYREAMAAIREYLREYDNPVPDLNLRRLRREQMRAVLAKHDANSENTNER